MLDPKLIRNNPEAVKAGLKNRKADVSLVNKFLGGWLDEVAMVNAVRPDLYRNRK